MTGPRLASATAPRAEIRLVSLEDRSKTATAASRALTWGGGFRGRAPRGENRMAGGEPVGETPPVAATLFFDGGCRLCHGAVLFLLRRDREGTRFLFAPIGGASYHETVSPAERMALPDSIVLKTEEGRLLVRSDALVEALARLGGGWRAVAALLRHLPRPLRDGAYDVVARARKRLFAPPGTSCPAVPETLRQRFRP